MSNFLSRLLLLTISLLHAFKDHSQMHILSYFSVDSGVDDSSGLHTGVPEIEEGVVSEETVQ